MVDIYSAGISPDKITNQFFVRWWLLERVGTIVEIKGDIAVVSMRRHLSCGSCGRCGGILSGEDRGEHQVEVRNSVSAHVGDQVVIETDDRRMIFISFMLYMVPLFALVVGILGWIYLAGRLGMEDNQELSAIGIGFGLMALVFWQLRSWDQRAKSDPRYRPVVVRVAQDSDRDKPQPVK